jgi:tetratricopeptide (TPR) repeat protein
MKKLASIFMVLLALQTVAFGQKKNVRKAGSALDKGELAEAKAQIDPAINDEKTKDDGGTWLLYGRVYQAIADDSTNSVQAEDPYLEAMKGYDKAMELEKEGSTDYAQAELMKEQVWANAVNKGAALYTDKDYANAITYFDVAKMAKPQDTTAYIYAGISAQQAGELNDAAKNYAFLVDSLDYKSEDFYNSLIYIYLVEQKDNDKAIDYLQKAQEAFPENPDFLKREITVLITNEKYDEAREKLSKAIEAEPDNAILYYNRGYLYEQMGDGEQAVENYKKATELDPNYFDASFNLAAFYYNEAAEILQEANNMDLKEYEKRGKEIEDKAKDYFEKALPPLEKSRDLKPDDEKVLTTLQTVYTRLGMDEKAEEVQSKLESM